MESELHREGVFARTVDEAVGFVSQRLSVHVVGLHGSGRSELLDLIADRLDDEGMTILRLFGNPSWRQEPFAALFAAGVAPASGPAPGARRSVGEMSAALAKRLGGGRVAVVCDDADDLDPHSVGALVSVHRQRRLVAVTSSRPRLPISPDSLLLGLTPAARVRPPIFDVDGVHTICRTILGGPVDAVAVARIATESGGLAGLVRAIVTIGRASGALQLHDGVWTVPGEIWTPHLSAAVEHYLAGAEQAVWDGATALAVTGPVRLDEAEQLVEKEVFDRLVAVGLVHHSGGMVGLFPPLLGEYLRREWSAFGRLQSSGAAPDPALTSLAPVPISQSVGADAAVRNQRMLNRAAADVVRLEREWRAHPTPASALPLLVAMRAAARPAEQIEYVVSSTPDEDSFADAQMRSWFATWLAAGQDRLAEALTVLDNAADRLPDHRDFLEVTRAHVRWLRDRVPSLDSLEHLHDSLDTELLRVLRAEILLAAGKTAQVRALLADFQPTGRVATGQARWLAAQAAVQHGDLEDGVALARRGYQEAIANRDPGLQQAHAFTAVWGLGVGGRLTEAAQVLADAQSACTVASYRDVYYTGLLNVGAALARAQGRPAHAAALAAQAYTTGTGRSPFVGTDRYRQVTQRSGGVVDLWNAVDERLEDGFDVSGLLMAVDAMEVDPDEERAKRVVSLGRAMEGRLLPALADYVAAATTDDEPGLVAAAAALRSTGSILYAIHADVTRILLLRRWGRAAEAAEAADQTWRQAGPASYQHAGLFWRLRDDIGLSAREAEILSLLASQPSVADVARTLQSSTRTVENHVYNIGRKVGVSGREALVRAAGTWLRFEPI